MKLLLVNPPIARYDYAELAPPLGLLVLAARARTRGIEVEILDLNLPVHRPMGDADGFYEYCLDLASVARPDEVGVTGMGPNGHVAIRIGAELRQRLGTPVTLGGVHLSSIADTVKRLAPEIDRVATPLARRSAEGRASWWGESPEEDSEDADALFADIPLEPYFTANPRRVANLTAGAGCKYRCAFCYSPAYHGGWRVRWVESVARDMRILAGRGFRHVFVVDDNLTNSAEWARSLAGAIITEGASLTWNGYATLPDLDRETVRLLGAAGCVNLYLGIDATEPEQQKAWRKRFYHGLERISALVEEGKASGVRLTCAFILDLHEEASRARDANLECAIALSRLGADIRLSVLTPYPSTTLTADAATELDDIEYSEARTTLLMDLPQVVVENALAVRAPRAFPWHMRPVRCASWDQDILAVAVLHHVLTGADNRAGILARNPSGRELWNMARDVARRIEGLSELHKTEIKPIADATFRSLMYS